MKRLLVLGSIAVTAAVLLGVFSQTAKVTEADTFDILWDVQFCDTFTPGDAGATCLSTTAGPTTAGANPTYVTHLQIQPLGGAAAQPFFDLATTTWSTQLVAAAGNTVDIGAFVGEIDFEIESNTNLALASSNNIDPTTGAPPACDAVGTITVAPPPSRILNSVTTPTTNPTMTAAGFNHAQYVQSFDDDDNDLVEFTAGVDPGDGGDTFPETQGDDNGNSIPDGSERMPDFIPRLLNAAGLTPVFSARGYAIAVVVPSASQVDVNFLTLNLGVVGGGYVSITTIGVVDPASVYNPATAAQTSLTCTPFTSKTTTYGVSMANGVVPGGDTVRTVSGAGNITYVLNTSTTEDYDADGVAAGIDRCATDPAGGAADGDGDGLSGTCDPNPGSADNGGGGLSVNNTYPWTNDQDIELDGVHNFSDNCPTVANPTQRDSDSDGVGNECDPKPALGNARSGVPVPVNSIPSGWVQNGHDHDTGCNDPVTIGALEGLDQAINAGCDPVTSTPNADASDDGVQDFSSTVAQVWSAGGGGTGHNDVNSDADHDGVSDAEEDDGDGNCDGNPLNSDTDGDGTTIDGAEVGPGAVLCWVYDANTNATSGLNPNGAGGPDSDNDGCSNFEERGATTTAGGNRDALWPYDFTDVPGPASGGQLTPASVRNKSIALADVLTVLAYVGRTNAHPLYIADNNVDGIPDGLQLDRAPAGGGKLANAPSGSVTLTDALVTLSQVGHSCTAAP